MRRPGFTLVEMLIVVSMLGILATIVTPKFRDARERAEAAALLERVHAVQLAYEAADEPAAATLKAPKGVVPAVLREGLSEGHFAAEGGLTIMTGQVGGNQAVLFVFAGNPTQERVLAEVNRQMAIAHRYSRSLLVVGLNAPAIAAMAPRPLAPVAVQTPVATGQPAPQTVQPPVPDPTPQAVPSVLPSTATPSTPQTPAPAVTNSGAPVCSASLPPGQYRHCLAGETTGYFRNH